MTSGPSQRISIFRACASWPPRQRDREHECYMLMPVPEWQHRSGDLASISSTFPIPAGPSAILSSVATIIVSRMAPRVANRTRISTKSLETMGAAALAGVLVEHAKIDSVLRRKLQLLLAGKEGSGKLVAEIEKRIRTIGRSKSLIGWERTKDVVQELDHLRETIVGSRVMSASNGLQRMLICGVEPRSLP